MTESNIIAEDSGRFMSLDCVDFWLDGPGDHTVRPCRPEHLEHAKAERAKILEALAAQGQTPPKDINQS